MNNLFESDKEKNATERVLAAIRVKDLNEGIDELLADILKYAKEMDDLLANNNLEKRFLNKVSAINESVEISLDDDLNNVDFRIREILEDLVKRINTRLVLIKEKNSNLLLIEQTYDLKDFDLINEIKIAHLTEEDFV